MIDWFKKRQSIGRSLAGQIGLWSSNWVNRFINWNEHIARSAQYNNVLAELRSWHDPKYLMPLRLRFVPEGLGLNGLGSRNRPDAGRLGSRVFGGTPQPRWETGVKLAYELKRIEAW